MKIITNKTIKTTKNDNAKTTSTTNYQTPKQAKKLNRPANRKHLWPSIKESKNLSIRICKNNRRESPGLSKRIPLNSRLSVNDPSLRQRLTSLEQRLKELENVVREIKKLARNKFDFAINKFYSDLNELSLSSRATTLVRDA